jgi:hypothetical protein
MEKCCHYVKKCCHSEECRMAMVITILNQLLLQWRGIQKATTNSRNRLLLLPF